MFGLSRGSLLPGWIGCAPDGDQLSIALVQVQADQRPAVRWASREAWQQPTPTLQRLRRRLSLHRHRRVALLQRTQYQCLAMDAPADVPRNEWPLAVRWMLKDLVDFAVDSAALDVLAVPQGTSYRTQPMLIAVAAAADPVGALVSLASDAGLPWQAIDIAESALRNLSALLEPEGRAQALLHCQASHATLVVTYQGELLSTRQIDLSLLHADTLDDAARLQAYEQAALELQRTLDGIERSFGQITMARLLITPMPGLQALCDHLGPLLYVPVQAMALDEVLDLSAVPDLAGDPLRLNQQLTAIGAALRSD